MYKRIIVSIVLLAIFSKSNAQTEPLFSISLSELGPGYELPLTSNMTAKMQLGFYSTNLSVEEFDASSYTSSSYFFVHAGGQASLRYYYNFNRRNDLGKNTNRNSANYFGLMNIYLAKPLTYLGPDCGCTDAQGNPARIDSELREAAIRGFRSGLVWGMQRNYERRFSLDLSFGLGYDFRESTPMALINTAIGFWLGKRY